MMDGCTALVIARAERLRESLRALLSSIPAIQNVLLAESLTRAFALAEQRHPQLVLVEASRAEKENGRTVREVKRRLPDSICIVLIEDVQQERQALESGADAALLQGAAPTELVSVCERLLTGKCL